MDCRHALGNQIVQVVPLGFQQTVMAFPNRGHQAIQLRDFLIAEAAVHGHHQPDLVQSCVCLRLTGQVVQIGLEAFHHIGCCIKHLHLIFEEAFHGLQVVLAVEQVILQLQNPVNQGNVVLLLAEHIRRQLNGLLHLALIGIVPAGNVALVQGLVMGFQLPKPFDNITYQTVLIIGNAHHIKEVPQELLDGLHLNRRHHLPLGDAGLADLISFPQQIGKFRIAGLDGGPPVLDGHLLLIDQQRHHRGDVDLAPAIGNLLVPALDVIHGSRQIGALLHLQKLFHLGGGIPVGLSAGDVGGVQNVYNVRIGAHVLGNETQITVHMGHQILQRLVDMGFGIPRPNLNVLAVHIIGGLHNRLFQIFQRRFFALLSFLLLIADDILDGLGQLGHIPLLHILVDFHGPFQGLIVRRPREYHNGLAMGFRQQTELGFLIGIGGHRQKAQLHPVGNGAHRDAVHHFIEVEIVLVFIAEFPGLVDIRIDLLTDPFHNGSGVHHCVADIPLYVLFFIGQEVIDIPRPADIVLAQQPAQRGIHLFPQGNLVGADIVGHQDHQIVQVGRNIIHIPDQVKELEHVHILLLDACAAVGGVLAPLNHPTDGTVQERVDRVIKPEERHQGILVPVLDFLGCLLESRQHRPLAAGQMLAGVAMLADLSKHFLHNDELIGHKGKIRGKFLCSFKALDVQNRAGKTEQIPEHRIILLVQGLQLFGCLRLFLQNTLLNHFVHRGGGQAQPGFEPGLNPRELISPYLDDFVNGFLAGAHNPHFAAAFTADFFGQGLQVQQHIGICAHILPHLVDHEQKPEVSGLFLHIVFDIFHQLCDGELHGRLVVEPALGILFAHVQHFHQSRNDVLAIEGKGLSLFGPGLSLSGLKGTAESIGFSQLVQIFFQHGHLQILAVEPQVIVKHLGKNPEDSGFIFVDGPLNVNIEQNGLGLSPGGAVNQHEGRRIIRKLLAKPFHRGNAVNHLVFQNVRKHLQKVRFTTSEKAGNPHANVICGFLKRVAVIIEEVHKVLLQFFCDDILPDLLLNGSSFILLHLDHAFDFAVDILGEHIANQHL